jgi:serine/threonine protein kinase
LLRRIGKGSYGEVWLARNVMGTYRAVKLVFRATFQNEHPYEREYSGIQKFEPVSRSHDGLVDILQIGRNDPAGFFYYVMELADDQTGQPINTENPDAYVPKTLLSATGQLGGLPFDECLRLGLSLASAVGHLHTNGLIHRDIKPSNIILVNGSPKLADIGLVAGLDASLSFVGTEGFMPPEGPGTAQADIYSLGKVLYEISSGKDRQAYPDPSTRIGHSADSWNLTRLYSKPAPTSLKSATSQRCNCMRSC